MITLTTKAADKVKVVTTLPHLASIAREVGGAIEPIPPERRRSPRTAPGDLDWLIANVTGQPMRRTSEAAAVVEVAALAAPRDGEAPTAAC